MVGHRTLARRAARFIHRRAVTSRVRWSANGPRCQLPGTVRTEIPSGAGRSGFLCRITTARPGKRVQRARDAHGRLRVADRSRKWMRKGPSRSNLRSQTCQPSVALDLREVRRRVERGLDEHQRRRRQRRSSQRGHRGAKSDTGDRPSLAVRCWCRADTVVARGDQAIEGRGLRIALAVFEAGPVHDEPRAPEVAHGPSQLMAPLEQLLPLHAPRWAHQHPQ